MGSLDHIPGGRGLPLIGHSLAFARDARTLSRSMHERYGDVFAIRVLGRPVVVFVTPEATREIYLDRGRVLSSEQGWSTSIGPLFRNGLMLRDFEDHRFHRDVMKHAFRRRALAGYVGTIRAVTGGHVAMLPIGETVDMYAAMKRLTLDIAAAVFAGLPPGSPEAETMNRAFVAMMAASVLPARIDLPGTRYRRGLEARRVLERLFRDLVGSRRTGPEGDDLLSRLCHAKDAGGRLLGDAAVVDHMIFLLLAAHDTTTATLSVMLGEMALAPEWQDRVIAEIETLGGAPVDLDSAGKLDVVARVFKEATRLHPPVPFSPRVAIEPLEIDGVAVPAGTMVSAASLLLHRHPRYWTDPDRFDPDRFGPGREEHRAHSHVFIPFGGGAHTCLGNHFAELMVKVIVVALLRATRLDAAGDRRVRFRAVPIPRPEGELLVTLTG
jgi:cytochrome P450